MIFKTDRWKFIFSGLLSSHFAVFLISIISLKCTFHSLRQQVFSPWCYSAGQDSHSGLTTRAEEQEQAADPALIWAGQSHISQILPQMKTPWKEWVKELCPLSWDGRIHHPGLRHIFERTGRSVDNTELVLLFCIAVSFVANMLTLLTKKVPMPTLLDPRLYYLLLNLCFCATAWPRGK